MSDAKLGLLLVGQSTQKVRCRKEHTGFGFKLSSQRIDIFQLVAFPFVSSKRVIL